MAWRVERADAVDADLDIIFDFLVAAALDYGEDTGTAMETAARRVRLIEAAMDGLATTPRQGTLHPEIEGLRHVTKDRAILYFDLHEDIRMIRVIAVFFGGQDHSRRMLRRLLSGQRR